ncbi:hypothetical protein [Haloarchaeobius sp. HRN-SO-5]|uniref:hypothetical protein n=1 Tax=Haloarchaeobius sp. HRN-SO-5 TaxID=3446118 RepID=UPI003EBA165D
MDRYTDDERTFVHDPAHEDTEHVGVLEKGTNVFYQANESMFYHTELDEERQEHTFVRDSGRHVGAEETVASVIEDIGDSWDSLSEWAKDHLEDDENRDGP